MLTLAGGWIIYSWFREWEAKLRSQTSILLAILSSSAIYAALSIFSDAPQVVQAGAIGILIFMVICFIVAGVRHYRADYMCWTWRRLGKGTWFATAVFAIGLLFAIYHSMVFVQLYQARPGLDDVAEWAAFGVWLIVQAVCIGLVASSRTSAALFKTSGAVGAVGLFLLPLLSNNPTFIVQRVAQTLGIGALPNVNLAVTQEGCQVLNALSEGKLCAPVSDKPVYMGEPVTLRSRFGKEVLIEYANDQSTLDNAEKVVYRIVLQATEVLGWQRRGTTSDLPTHETTPET